MLYVFRMPTWNASVPSLSSLIAFEAAHRHRNFTRAAAELHYSQATVSRRIAALEADLGTLLFERGGQLLHPTDEADALAEVARVALGDLARASDSIRRRSSERTGLTIRSDVSMTAAVINPVLGEFQQRHPELDIRVLSSFDPIEFEDEKFDLGLQYGRDRESQFVIEPVADDEVFPVCAPGFGTQVQSLLAAGRVPDIPLLHIDYGEPAWVDWKQFAEATGIDRSAVLDGPTFSAYLVGLDLAGRGDGVALGWGHTVQPRIDAGKLERIPGFTMQIPDAILQYRFPEAPRWGPVEDLVELIRTRLK